MTARTATRISIKTLISLAVLSVCAFAQRGVFIAQNISAASSVHTFTIGTNKCLNQGNAETTAIDCTLSAAPTSANFVVVGILSQPSSCITGVADLSGNTYTKTTNSPSSTNDATAGTSQIYYRQPTGTENTTIRATLSGTCIIAIRATVFNISPSAGTVIDVDAPAGSGTTGTTINTPTITSPTTGALLYCFAASENAITAVGSGWTEDPNGHASGFGEDAEYNLSASGTKAASFTQSSGHWDSNCASFR